MNYIIELTETELNFLKRTLKEEFEKMRCKPALQDPYGDTCLESYKQHQLLILLGKLDNIILVANNLTEDTSILAKRKYGLFKRK